MSTFIYSRPSDSLLPQATTTLSISTGAADAAYPPANLADGHVELPAKLSGTSGAWLANLGSARRVDLVSVLHHNLDQSLNVRLQGNATDSWGTPSIDLPFTIPARLADSFTVNVWMDLTVLIPIAANRTMQYWRLAIVGVNSVPVSVGEWLMYGTKRDFGIRNIRPGSDRTIHRPTKVHRTDVGVKHVFDLGVTIRSVRIDINPDDAYLADIDALFRDALAQFKPFMIVPHSSENDAWFVSIDSDEFTWKRLYGPFGFYPATVTFVEEARGLYP